MRILFVSSNLYAQFPATFPNGVGALSAWLKQHGFEISTLHLFEQRDLRRLRPLLEEVQPDVVAISVVTCEARIVGPVSKIAKQWNPQVTVLAGGIHFIIDPESALEIPEIDAVCYSEGETSVLEYLQRMQRGDDVTKTPGFAFRDQDGHAVKNQRIEFIRDLETLPTPDWEVADLQRVIDANNGVINLLLSRGCPWKCAFCGNEYIRRQGTGLYARILNVDRAIAMLEDLASRYRFREIVFRDDTFTWNKEWALDFLEKYRKRFTFPIHIFSRVDTLDDELVDALKRAGCTVVFLGLDSGNEYIRNKILNKEQGSEELDTTVEQLERAGITPVISNIVGLPYETPEMFKDTIEANKRIYKKRIGFTSSFGIVPKIWVFTPWPKTDLHTLCEKEGWISEDPSRARVYRQSVLSMPQFSPKEINREFRLFRYKVYKDSFPIRALMIRMYDSRPVQAIFERLPVNAMGVVRQTLLHAWNKFVPRPGKRVSNAIAPGSES